MVLLFKAFLAGLGLTVLESTLIKAIEIGGIRPDLAVVAVVIVALRSDFLKTMVLAFVFGLMRDFVSAGPVGMNALALTVTAYLLSFAKDFLITDNTGSQMLTGFVGSVIFGTLFTLLKLGLQFEIGSISRSIEMVFWISLYTTLATPPAFALLTKSRFPSYMRLKMKYDVEHETVPQTKV